jgi:hypothetical protein
MITRVFSPAVGQRRVAYIYYQYITTTTTIIIIKQVSRVADPLIQDLALPSQAIAIHL